MLTIWALTIATVLKAEVVALLLTEVGSLMSNVVETEIVGLFWEGSKAEILGSEHVTLAEYGGVALGAKTTF